MLPTAKFGGAQAKQGRALATLSLVQFLSRFGFKLVVSKGNYVPIAILIKENDERPNVDIIRGWVCEYLYTPERLRQYI